MCGRFTFDDEWPALGSNEYTEVLAVSDISFDI
jgi:hypothetical protein